MNETMLDIIKSITGIIFGGGGVMFWKWRQQKRRQPAELILANAQADKTHAEADRIREKTKIDISDKALSIADNINDLLELHNKDLREEVTENRRQLTEVRKALQECQEHRIEDDLRFRKLELQMSMK